ncbi:MAG TPA: fatty acyl-AMP ligase, partial [Polyangia bacterium]|nr:fatty acyl-AMP ligase [Polyangia bacterium]
MTTPITLLHSTLTRLVLERAAATPGALAYTFLSDGETTEETLDYGGLARRALAIAGQLQAAGARGEPVLLLFPPGLDYVAGFLGCVCAGAIAVPAYPPDPSRLGRTLPRLASLVADARARFALTMGPIRGLVEAMGLQAGTLAQLKWLAVEEASDATREQWRDPGAQTDDIAFLQYTSGSTGNPRGVVLSHANLLQNSVAIQRCFETGADSRGVIWLPPYHDMGLIGGVLQPLFGGFPVVLMSPLAFLARPLRWLQAISRHRGTVSGGPNFAFDLCVRKIGAADRAALDLSSWEVAFNGAEPINPDTLDRFAAAFEPCGFRREAFFPCYGLAEGTLIVTGGRKADAPVRRAIDKAQLAAGVAAPADSDGVSDGNVTLVGCGRRVADTELLVVDPERHLPAAPGRVGEVWVRGPGVARGYWQRSEESQATFGARRADTDDGGWLRTGDLGFVADDELFVTGRMKDLIIVRGRNLYPHDLERTAVACHVALRPGCAAAFAVSGASDGDGEQLVLVLEVDANKPFDPPALIDDIRAAIAVEHEVQAQAIVLVAAGSVPKTSSGKIQRRACRQQYVTGELTPLAQSVLNAAAAMEEATVPTAAALAALTVDERAAALLP